MHRTELGKQEDRGYQECRKTEVLLQVLEVLEVGTLEVRGRCLGSAEVCYFVVTIIICFILPCSGTIQSMGEFIKA